MEEAIEKVEQGIANAINEGGLPLPVVSLILDKFVGEVRIAALRMKQEAAAAAESAPDEAQEPEPERVEAEVVSEPNHE